jgi:hypothetical protein
MFWQRIAAMQLDRHGVGYQHHAMSHGDTRLRHWYEYLRTLHLPTQLVSMFWQRIAAMQLDRHGVGYQHHAMSHGHTCLRHW